MDKTQKGKKLFASIENYLIERANEFQIIPDERKKILEELSLFMREKEKNNDTINLTFICTHNSRRSHMGQLWAQAAAYYYGIENVNCYSGGTETTAFNERSVKALRKAGFQIEKKDDSENPLYLVRFAEDREPLKGFSKKYEHLINPQTNYAAIMTCSHANEACPVVVGASKRIAITYNDPKEADDTSEEVARYDERCQQIAREMLYVFSKI